MEHANDDLVILGIAKQLCQDLGVGESIDTVLWRDRVDPKDPLNSNPSDLTSSGRRRVVRSVSTHYPLILSGIVILAEKMRGRLEPKEWGPLIASSLLYEKRLSSELRPRVFIDALPVFLAIAGLISAVLLRIVWFYIVLVFSLVPLTLLSLLQVRGYEAKLRLRADSKASDLVGREPFLEVLGKIDRIDLKGGRNEGIPSIVKRIENLQTTTLFGASST